ncbi:hypothetical protein ACVILL_000340 [Bradyrhizobium sp. USDA 3364]
MSAAAMHPFPPAALRLAFAISAGYFMGLEGPCGAP